MNGLLFSVLAAAALAGPASAQMQQRARLTGGGSAGEGRCYAEVVVDGAAELQVSGDTATLRNLSGSRPQWRRFECTSPMPANADVRLNINGRGRGQLVASPRNGGPAVVRIEDEKGGASVYQLEFQWTGGYGTAYDRGYDDNRRFGRVSLQEALNHCREAVRDEARSHFGTGEVLFRHIDVDNNRGNRDFVVGTVGVRRAGGEDMYPFTCRMNLANGRVRRVHIEGVNRRNPDGYATRDIPAREMDTCRSAVMNRIGGDRVEFGPMNIEDRNGADVVRGTARSRGRDYDFACSVSPYSGSVRDVDVRRR